MADTLISALAFACSCLGMGWFALAKQTHWRQVRGAQPLSPAFARGLRYLGATVLCGGLILCLLVDHAPMASLVWVMSLTAGALAVAFTLAWRPSSLAWLVGWLPAGSSLPASRVSAAGSSARAGSDHAGG